mmetsp:Transcript_15177/g.38889  ORF Transcript_15177/g.38889 Transcript_15177/m.38889 type:complete len:81 (-) Transcript_15177:139-381(-)
MYVIEFKRGVEERTCSDRWLLRSQRSNLKNSIWLSINNLILSQFLKYASVLFQADLRAADHTSSNPQEEAPNLIQPQNRP